MTMSAREIALSYKTAKDKKNQITVLADLNCCSKDEIKNILAAEGITAVTSKSAILNMAIEKYGPEAQTDMAIEEMSELIKALLKLRRYPDSEQAKKDVLEEMADVSIMLDQLKIIYGGYGLERYKKLKRLHNRLTDADDMADIRKKIEEAGE